MFVPFLTPVWGVLAKVRGREGALDEVVWGKGVPSYAEVAAKDKKE